MLQLNAALQILDESLSGPMDIAARSSVENQLQYILAASKAKHLPVPAARSSKAAANPVNFETISNGGSAVGTGNVLAKFNRPVPSTVQQASTITADSRLASGFTGTR
jgi:hypothetical protein